MAVVVDDVRVSALSPTLLRLEPRGPLGWEDDATFGMPGRSAFPGTGIDVLNKTADGSWLRTDQSLIYVPSASAAAAPCAAGRFQNNTDVTLANRSPKFPDGATTDPTQGWDGCCELCAGDTVCTAWVFAPDLGAGHMNCWPLASFGEAHAKTSPGTRVFGAKGGRLALAKVVERSSGALLWSGSAARAVAPNLLHWPSPGDQPGYAVSDQPRFRVPAWGPVPPPPNVTVDPAIAATGGYDFRNDVADDTYIFVLGGDLDGWWQSRAEFLTLTGSTPLLPDYAYGIWYTWYIPYTEQQAKYEIGQWEAGRFPLDVWGLDMDWRNVTNATKGGGPDSCRSQTNDSPGCEDHFYNHPNNLLMPGLLDGEWFGWLKQQKLRTYFNDHPYPAATQASPKEIAFRHEGLTYWIGQGLNFWWFDHNWAFTVPGPLEPYNVKDAHEGLTGQVWGSHLYYDVTAAAYKSNGTRINDRPIALSRDNGPNWRTADADAQCLQGAGTVAHHRYPVWWTGDGVSLMASVQSMVLEAGA